MRRLKNLSLQQLTLLMSVLLVMLFLLFYFSFKVFWSFDREVSAVVKRQQNEVERVRVLLTLAENQLITSLEDYAAWDSMIKYTEDPSDEFVMDNIGIDATEPNLVDGIAIFDDKRNFIWGGWYRGDTVQEKNILDERSQPKVNALLNQVSAFPEQYIQSLVTYTIFDNQPYLLAASKICNSHERDCRHGYLVFVRQIKPMFTNAIALATGVDLSIQVLRQGALATPLSNHSLLFKQDPLGDDRLTIDIGHSEHQPKFVTLSELSALSGFVALMMLFNIGVVSILVRPIKDAQIVLETFQRTGGKLPNAKSFYSKEMRSFAHHINKLITQLEVRGAQLQWQSYHDPLTGIANRRGLYDSLERYVNQHHFQYIAIVLLDIDYFKPFNDNYDHLHGDKALKRLAQALNDIETTLECLVCRFGGEEFCFAFASDSPINIEKQLHIIRRKIESLGIKHEFSPTSKFLTVSIGAATRKVTHYAQVEPLFQRADEALYTVKNSGKDNYKVDFADAYEAHENAQ